MGCLTAPGGAIPEAPAPSESDREATGEQTTREQ